MSKNESISSFDLLSKSGHQVFFFVAVHGRVFELNIYTNVVVVVARVRVFQRRLLPNGFVRDGLNRKLMFRCAKSVTKPELKNYLTEVSRVALLARDSVVCVAERRNACRSLAAWLDERFQNLLPTLVCVCVRLCVRARANCRCTACRSAKSTRSTLGPRTSATGGRAKSTRAAARSRRRL